MPKVFGIEELAKALDPFIDNTETAGQLAFDIHAALKSAVRAVTPGRQQRTNLDPVVKEAQQAFIRTLKRRAKAL